MSLSICKNREERNKNSDSVFMILNASQTVSLMPKKINCFVLTLIKLSKKTYLVEVE
jgi:NifU-like protein involved in Fe-S cluster formation